MAFVFSFLLLLILLKTRDLLRKMRGVDYSFAIPSESESTHQDYSPLSNLQTGLSPKEMQTSVFYLISPLIPQTIPLHYTPSWMNFHLFQIKSSRFFQSFPQLYNLHWLPFQKLTEINIYCEFLTYTKSSYQVGCYELFG